MRWNILSFQVKIPNRSGFWFKKTINDVSRWRNKFRPKWHFQYLIVNSWYWVELGICYNLYSCTNISGSSGKTLGSYNSQRRRVRSLTQQCVRDFILTTNWFSKIIIPFFHIYSKRPSQVEDSINIFHLKLYFTSRVNVDLAFSIEDFGAYRGDKASQFKKKCFH